MPKGGKTGAGYVCRLCGAERKGNARTAWQHVLDHLFHGGVEAASLSAEVLLEYRLRQARLRRSRQQALGEHRKRKGLGGLLRR